MGSPVRVEQEPFRLVSGLICFPERDCDEVHIRLGGDIPCDHLAGEQVDDHAEIIPFSAGLDVSKIACPDEVGCLLGKLLLQMVGVIPV